jgi:hypothetical protein
MDGIGMEEMDWTPSMHGNDEIYSCISIAESEEERR